MTAAKRANFYLPPPVLFFRPNRKMRAKTSLASPWPNQPVEFLFCISRSKLRNWQRNPWQDTSPPWFILHVSLSAIYVDDPPSLMKTIPSFRLICIQSILGATSFSLSSSTDRWRRHGFQKKTLQRGACLWIRPTPLHVQSSILPLDFLEAAIRLAVNESSG